MRTPTLTTHRATIEPDPCGKRLICAACIRERYLSNRIQTEGGSAFCSYCDNEAPTFSVEEVANLIEIAFENHYEITPTEPDGLEDSMHRDPESNYEWERRGEPAIWAIARAAKVDEKVATDIQLVLEDRHFDHEAAKMGEESPFASESHHAEKDAGHGDFLNEWNKFVHGLKTEKRFFSSSAKSTLDQIFSGVSEFQSIIGGPVVMTIGPETNISTLYRARVFAGQEEVLKEALKDPARHLGTPPANAAGSGRMNAQGIAVFYGARDTKTALAETRPPVGSKVAIASFHILRPLRLLNLPALRYVATPGSIFDPATIARTQRGNFLEVLSQQMSRPVMPHEEVFEYLPTQAVADYLANELRLDGIIFSSIQTGEASSNVVLFHHAARVKEVELPKGTEVEVYLETGDSEGSPDYTVWEKTPAPSPSIDHLPRTHQGNGVLVRRFNEKLDVRLPALGIDCQSIIIHHVGAVRFSTEQYAVARHKLR